MHLRIINVNQQAYQITQYAGATRECVMDTTVSEVLQFVRENDVKFVRLVFSDVCGTIKNIAVTAEELPRAFEAGNFPPCPAAPRPDNPPHPG